MTESTVMLAASVDINTLQFSLLKKLIKSIDKSMISRKNNDLNRNTFAFTIFLVCFQLDLMNTAKNNDRIVGFLYINTIFLIGDLFDFIIKILTSKLFDISVSIQLNKDYWKQFKVVIITLLFVSILFGIQFRVLARINDTYWFRQITILNLMIIFEMLTNLTVYAILVTENLIDCDLDEKIYYIKAFANMIEFLSSIILFLFGIYIQYESMSVIRAGFLVLSTCGMFLKAKEGWSTLIKRKAVHLKISNMLLLNNNNNDEYSIDEFKCPICYRDLSLVEARITHCRHTFHAGCLKKWIYINSKCPMCNKNI